MEHVIKLPYSPSAFDKPEYYDEDDRLYNNAFLPPEVVRLRKKLINSYIYKYGTGREPITGDVAVHISICCRRYCDPLLVGKNIIEPLYSEHEKIITDDRQIVSLRIVQMYSMKDVVSVNIKPNVSDSREFLFSDDYVSFEADVLPCETILPEFRRVTDKFDTSDKNEVAIRKHIKYICDNYPEVIRKPIRSPVRMAIDICTRSKRMDLDNIALLILLALQRSGVLPDPKRIRVLDINLKRSQMAEKAVITLFV